MNAIHKMSEAVAVYFSADNELASVIVPDTANAGKFGVRCYGLDVDDGEYLYAAFIYRKCSMGDATTIAKEFTHSA